MTTSTLPSADLLEFLREHSGVYIYRRWIVRVCYWFGVFCLCVGPIVLLNLLFEPLDTPRKIVDALLLFVAIPSAIWLMLGFGMRFHRLEISEQGVSIFPLGLNLPADQISDAEIVARGGKKQRIKLGLSSPKLSLHMFAWSLGRTVMLVFNENLLKKTDSR